MIARSKSKPLVFSNPASVRNWLEHGTGKGLLEQLTSARVAAATEHLTAKIEEARLLQRQMVVVVLESDGQLREIYGTDNVSVAVRALLVNDEHTDIETENYMVSTLPAGIRRAFDGMRGKLKTNPLLHQTAESEEARLNKLTLLRVLRDGTWRELLEIDKEASDAGIYKS